MYPPETWLRFHSTSVKSSDTRFSQPIDDSFLTKFAPPKKMASFCNFTFLRKPASWPNLLTEEPSARRAGQSRVGRSRSVARRDHVVSQVANAPNPCPLSQTIPISKNQTLSHPSSTPILQHSISSILPHPPPTVQNYYRHTIPQCIRRRFQRPAAKGPGGATGSAASFGSESIPSA
jgi:hypothetical protein